VLRTDEAVKEAKIGLLTERLLPPPYGDALRRGLTEAGWVEGRNLRIEQRSADGNLERLPGLTAELISSDVTVIVTGVGSPAALAAKKVTTSIPIVFVTGGDPVDFGIVPNRRKPGGNVTGFGGGIIAIQERLEMLRDMAPRTKRVAFLRNLTNPIHPPIWKAIEREDATRMFSRERATLVVPGGASAQLDQIHRERHQAATVRK
jgi:putative ABC transport system substrate-binding protein